MKNQSKKIISFVFNDFKRDIRVLKENITLQKNGFKVLVVATDGNDLKIKDIVKKIPVFRVRCNNIPIFPVNLIIYWIKTIWKFRQENIFHCNDLYTLPIGVVIKIFFNKKAKIVYDCHEYETDAGIYVNKPILKWLASIIEGLLIPHANEVITVSDSIVNAYKTKYKISKPKLVLNCPNYIKTEHNNLFRKEFNIPEDKKILLYQGEFTKHKINGVNLLIKTFSSSKVPKKLVLVLLGYGDLFEFMKKENKKNNIYFKNAVNIDLYMKYICSADYGIHILDNSCLNHEYALPNKIFEYTMASLPIIVSDLKEMRQFVIKQKIGVVLKKETIKSLIDSINNLIKMPKPNFQKVNKIYCWEKQEEVLVNLYKQL